MWAGERSARGLRRRAVRLICAGWLPHDRAWWMRHWLLGTRCIQTIEVFERREPFLLVGNDADDGLWQLIGATDAGSTGKIGHLHHAVDEDPTLVDVLDLPPGHSASRTRVGGPWTRHLGYPA